MYFLEKICRICIRPGAPLVDVETVDFDMVRLSEKLEICANLAISDDSISSEICEKCLNKLRVSYHFLDMCKKSTNILYGYIEKLQDRKNSQFDNCNLHVTLEKLPESELVNYERSMKHTDVNRNEVNLIRKISDVSNKISRRNSNLKRKQRITKGQRSYLLQQLLKRPKKNRHKSTSKMGNYYDRGALKGIVDFTRNFKFSYEIDKKENRVQQNRNKSPLDKLVDFSENYFRRDFSEFKNHIVCVIENRSENECRLSFSSDDDYESQSESEHELEFEKVVVEPDIEIKCEKPDYDYEDLHCQCLLNCLETSFEEEEAVIVKVEDPDLTNVDDAGAATCDQALLIKKSGSALSESQVLDTKNLHGTPLVNFQSNLCRSPSSAVLLLDRLVSSYPIVCKKVFSPSNVRCRTRNHPYINPTLKNQFLFRSFNCERCNKSFKSQGYLNAHVSKVH